MLPQHIISGMLQVLFSPAMLTEEMKAASTARVCAVLVGTYPPPISESPPTAVRPRHTHTHTRIKEFVEEGNRTGDRENYDPLRGQIKCASDLLHFISESAYFHFFFYITVCDLRMNHVQNKLTTLNNPSDRVDMPPGALFLISITSLIVFECFCGWRDC